MNSKAAGIHLGYTLGFSSLVAAVVYFYASNWPVLERWERFVPLFAMTVLLYGLSVWLSGRPGREPISRLSLIGSCLSFGVGLAVIGQTYNSHADSYEWFSVWAVSALLFSILSRWQPFYVLAYGLGHLALWFYFVPNGGWVLHSEGEWLRFLGLLAMGEGVLFWAARSKWISSPVLQFLSFVMLNGLVMVLSNTHAFKTYGPWFNLPLTALLLFSLAAFKRSGDRMYFLWTGLLISAAVVMKYTELAGHYIDDLFFVYSLVFTVLFVTGNIWFLKVVHKLFPSDPEEGGAEKGSTGGSGRFGEWAAKVLTLAAVLIGTLIGTFSIFGLLYLVLDPAEPEVLLMGGGFLLYGGMLLLRKASPVLRYTLIGIGLAMGAGTALFEDYRYVFWGFAGMTIYAFFAEKGLAKRTFFYICAVGMVSLLVMELLENAQQTLALMAAILLGSSLYGGRTSHSSSEIDLLLYRGGLSGFLAVLFLLSFLGESSWYYLYNAGFVLAAGLSLIYAFKKDIRWLQKVSFGFWTAFLVWKYYDFAWKLLHKSVSLALIGAAVMTAVWIYEKRQGIRYERAAVAAPRLYVWTASLLVVLQVVVMAAQIGRNEWLLTHGTTVKLELLPRDPRSLLQGDYVELRYGISEPRGGDELSELERFHYNKKVKIVLRPGGPGGVYEFARLLRVNEELRPGEVVINGRWNGYNGFQYGIENYFVPEGTGLEVEREARFAEVKVGAGGDAILVRLLTK